jgi:hypothetical protein
VGARPSSTTTKPTERKERQPTQGRGARKLNRSEQQAMRIRAAASAAAHAAAADDVPAEGARPVRASEGAARPSKAARTRALHYGTVLSRAQEMAYVRADLRRLLWIAGSLLVAMLILLAVLPT